MNIQIIIISEDNQSRSIYLDAVKAMGVHVDAVTSFRDAKKLLKEFPCNGVMIDMETKEKLYGNERKLCHEILEIFPVIQLKIEESNRIKTYYFGQAYGGGELEDFINRECKSFQPKRIRSDKRKRVVLNVLLSRTENFDGDDHEKTVTVDISANGCFIYSTRDWKLSETAHLVIKEIEDDTPIVGQVKWHVPWGISQRMPGIGIEYISVKKNQIEELSNRS